MLLQNEVKFLLLCLVKLDSRFTQAVRSKEVYLYQTCLSRNCQELCLSVTLVHESVGRRC